MTPKATSKTPPCFSSTDPTWDASRNAMASAKAVKRMFKAHMRSHGELVKVKTEARVYSKHGQHSYFADIAAVAAGRQAGTAYDAAKERQTRYAKELATEIRNGVCGGTCRPRCVP